MYIKKKYLNNLQRSIKEKRKKHKKGIYIDRNENPIEYNNIIKQKLFKKLSSEESSQVIAQLNVSPLTIIFPRNGDDKNNFLDLVSSFKNSFIPSGKQNDFLLGISSKSASLFEHNHLISIPFER